MKNEVTVWFELNLISVNGETLDVPCSLDLIKNKLTEEQLKEEIITLNWKKGVSNGSYFSTMSGTPLFYDETKYSDYVQPYVDVWQAEKDRIEQEQEEAEAEYNKFENRQARALTQLNTDFETVKERSHVKSSLGFEVDANQTANENVNGLLITIGDGTCQFCDYYNQFHELNKAQLETLQSEIIANAQNLYQQKWVYRTQIEGCTDNTELDTVLEGIKFTYMDFTQQTE